MNRTRRTVALIAAVAVQAALIGAAVAPQLSARTGEEYRLRVAPVDPIDPTRGAYVALDYPDLPSARTAPTSDSAPLPEGRVFVPLEVRDGLARGTSVVSVRPATGPYLGCDSTGYTLDCGIDSWFAPQSRAREIERHIDGAVATVRVDSRGHAALVDLTVGGSGA